MPRPDFRDGGLVPPFLGFIAESIRAIPGSSWATARPCGVSIDRPLELDRTMPDRVVHLRWHGRQLEGCGDGLDDRAGPRARFVLDPEEVSDARELRRRRRASQQDGTVLQDRPRAPPLRAADDLEGTADQVLGVAVGEAEERPPRRPFTRRLRGGLAPAGGQ